jgi:hypothetical protein
MPARRIANQTILLWRELRNTGPLAILCLGTAIARSAILNPFSSAFDEFVLKSRLLFLFRSLRESLPNWRSLLARFPGSRRKNTKCSALTHETALDTLPCEGLTPYKMISEQVRKEVEEDHASDCPERELPKRLFLRS